MYYVHSSCCTHHVFRRKEGAPQLTCNNSFAKTIYNILPSGTTLSSKNAPLKEWLPVAKCEKNWQFYIDQYFESCKNLDENDDEGDEVDEVDEEEIRVADRTDRFGPDRTGPKRFGPWSGPDPRTDGPKDYARTPYMYV
jgi:hypothetical protein